MLAVNDFGINNGKVHLSMKPYLDKALHQIDNVTPSKPQNLTYPHVPTKIGAKERFSEYNASPTVGEKDKKHVQTVDGIFCGRHKQ